MSETQGKTNANGNPIHKRGRQRDVLGYILSQPFGKHITIAELEKNFKNYTRSQLMATMAHMCNVALNAKYAYPVERITEGVWRAKDTRKPKQEELPLDEPIVGHDAPKAEPHYEELLVTIIKENDGEMVVVDDYANIYRMVKVG